jgi:hypothetical protein
MIDSLEGKTVAVIVFSEIKLFLFDVIPDAASQRGEIARAFVARPSRTQRER